MMLFALGMVAGLVLAWLFVWLVDFVMNMDDAP